MKPGATNSIIPVPAPDEAVAQQVPVEVGDLGLDKEGLEQAAAELGLERVKAPRMLAIKKLGEEQRKVGILNIGRYYMVRGAEFAERGAVVCEEILQGSDDPELKAQVVSTQASFSKQLMDIGEKFARTAELIENDGSQDRHRTKPFGAGRWAGPPVAIEQAVVTINQQEKK
jgi:hypothetical protein